jgi:hypothetical protein
MNEGTTRVDEAAELMKGPQGTAFKRFYGKAFLEDHLGNIRWKGSMKTALATKLARNPRWKGWIFQRTETREKDGIKTTLFIYDEMPNPRAKREKAEREPAPEAEAKRIRDEQQAKRIRDEQQAKDEADDEQDALNNQAEAQALDEEKAKAEAQADWEAEQEAQANQGEGN